MDNRKIYIEQGSGYEDHECDYEKLYEVSYENNRSIAEQRMTREIKER